MKHLDQRIRVPIEQDNPSIFRDEVRCIKCSNCSKVCDKFCSVLSEYNIKDLGHALCVNCGQCLMACPTNSIKEKSCLHELKDSIKKDKVVIISTSPAVRVSLGEEFNMPHGSLVEGKMVALLRKLGFNYVLDTNFGADVTVVEESNELINRLETNNGPMFSSCCPAWVKFLETFYPKYIKNLSTCKSPIGMQGALIKTYFAQKLRIDPGKIINVCLTPCVAKKMEIKRPELCSSAIINGQAMMDMDYSLTVREIAEWAKEEHIDFEKLKPSKFDKYMSVSSGAGAMFGKSGGVSEAVIMALKDMSPKDKSFYKNCARYQTSPAVKFVECEFKNRKIKIASVYGLKNVREVLDRINNGEKIDFVEVMACPGGCIGGGGQPKVDNYNFNGDYNRLKAIEQKGRLTSIKSSLNNPELKRLYKDYLKAPNSKLAKILLHTHYIDRSMDVKCHKKRVVDTYKCGICGQVFESKKTNEIKCPNCDQESVYITKLK